MRTEKELLQVMLDNLDEYFLFGLCNLTYLLCTHKIITIEEASKLSDYFYENRPRTFYNVVTANGYWWKSKRVKPRRKWLKKQIKKLSKQL